MAINFERGNDPRDTLHIGKKAKFKKWLENNGVCEKFKNNSDKGKLRIINLTTSVLKNEVIKFLESLINENKTQFDQSRQLKYKCCYGIYHLMNHIPIFIIDKVTMNNIIKEDGINNPDTLGWYTRINDTQIPVIYICIDRIEKTKEYLIQDKSFKYDDERTMKFLTAKVILHEFAHALMDVGLENMNVDRKESVFYKWIEEPMANLITLYCADHDSYFLSFTKEFIEKQPSEYIPRIELFDNNFDWMQWWDYKKESLNNNSEDNWLNERSKIYREIYGEK